MRSINRLAAPELSLPQPQEDDGRDYQHMGKRAEHTAENRGRQGAYYL